MNWTAITKNWRTTLTGVAGTLLNVPVFVSAIEAYAKHQPVDWRYTLITTTIAVISIGLVAAKDGATQSTTAQAAAQQAKVEGNPNAPVMAAIADQQAAKIPKPVPEAIPNPHATLGPKV